MPSILRLPRIAFSRFLANAIAGQQKMRESQFRALGSFTADIVFLGDSITEYGLWNEWFPGISVVNRGIAGDTTAGVLARLETALGVQRKLSLLIGTNDLSIGIAPHAVARNVGSIMSAIKEVSPGTEVVLNGVMPRTRALRGQILELNRLLEDLARTSGVPFLDTWRPLANEEGTIRSGFSTDNLHLTGPGYQAWTRELAPFLLQ